MWASRLEVVRIYAYTPCIYLKLIKGQYSAKIIVEGAFFLVLILKFGKTTNQKPEENKIFEFKICLVFFHRILRVTSLP